MREEAPFATDNNPTDAQRVAHFAPLRKRLIKAKSGMVRIRLALCFCIPWIRLLSGSAGVQAEEAPDRELLHGVPADFPTGFGQRDDASTLPGVVVRRDVAYLPAGRTEKLDLYLPPRWTAGARGPAVVWIHGGGWVNGGKAGTRERSVCHAFAAAGFVCASVDYRLGREGAWPENLLDVKNAVRYLRARADELGVDPDRIAVAGGSAGGHLALMAAYTAGESAFEPEGPYAGVSSAVRCVIDFYGITNLRTRRQTEADGTITDRLRAGGPASVFGTTELGAEIFRVASPVEYVSGRTPPTLILHGRADATVDHGQALELARILEQHGVPHELVLLDGVGHTFDFEGWDNRPLPRDVRSVAVEFLRRHTCPEGGAR